MPITGHVTCRRSLTRLSALLATAGCALATAACGSAGASHATSKHTSGFLAYSECMRSHGVSNFPDPGPGGGGIKFNLGSGINPAAPSFKAAQAACHKLLPGGGPGAQHPSAQAKAAMLRISECMRSHGVTGFPDPTLTPPASPQDYALIEDRGGVVLAVPDSINPNSPSFRHAAAACDFR